VSQIKVGHAVRTPSGRCGVVTKLYGDEMDHCLIMCVNAEEMRPAKALTRLLVPDGLAERVRALIEHAEMYTIGEYGPELLVRAVDLDALLDAEPEEGDHVYPNGETPDSLGHVETFTIVEPQPQPSAQVTREEPEFYAAEEEPTLRDRFAMAALTGFLAANPQRDLDHPDYWAREAYERADAMMRLRTQEEGG